MPSSNADSQTIDPTAFESRYGYSPQTYVERVALAQLLGANLIAELAELARVKAALTPGWESLSDTAAIQAGADAENRYLSEIQVVHGIESRQAAAKAFVAGGSFGAFRGGLGRMANVLIDNQLIDEDALRAALTGATA